LASLLQQVIDPDPKMRPSAISLLRHPVLSLFGSKSKAQLHRELIAEKLKNEVLANQLENAKKCIKSLAASDHCQQGYQGKRVKRSCSTVTDQQSSCASN
jgi:wee1-like protein kinase